MMAICASIGTETAAACFFKGLGFRIKDQVDIDLLTGVVVDESEKTLPTETDMGNKRRLSELSASIENFRLKLATYIGREISYLSKRGGVFFQLHDFPVSLKPFSPFL